MATPKKPVASSTVKSSTAPVSKPARVSGSVTKTYDEPKVQQPEVILEIPRVANELEANINALHETLRILMNRLEPVSHSLGGVALTDTPSNCYTPLGKHIESNSARVLDLNEMVRAMTDALAI